MQRGRFDLIPLTLIAHRTNGKSDDQEWLKLAVILLVDAALDDVDVDRGDVLAVIVESGALGILAVLLLN